MRPRQFGPYTLLEHMGKGGMGSVYRALETDSGRVMALKVFESGEERPPEVSRKLRDREVRMLVSVQHPNIVKFFESGQVDDDYFYTMEFVGRSLHDLMRSERELSIVRVVHVLRQTAAALGAIHHQAIVHRDVKPANVLLDEDPGGALHVKLTDLGIAKNVAEPDIVREQTQRAIPGTPRYLSPEQIKQGPLDGRSDVFSLGVMAYELLAGTRPFKAEEPMGYLRANLRQEQRPVTEFNPHVPPFLSGMVQRMLAKEPERRYDSETLARDLELVHQHLISQAPLVERSNPASFFYRAPPKAARRKQAAAGIHPLTYLLAAGIVLLGGPLVYLLWPPLSVPGEAPPAGLAGRIARAERAAADGRYWHVMALLDGSSQDDLPYEQARRFQLVISEARNALAERLLESGSQMLRRGRLGQVRLRLEQMKQLVPEAQATAELERMLRTVEPPPPEE